MKWIVLLLCILLNFTLALASGPGRDCICGTGIARTQDEADDNALLSLSKTVKATVNSSTRYSVSSTGRSVDESFSRVSSISTDLLITESQMEVSFDGQLFTVKRYIDKSRYVSDKMAEYKKWMDVAAGYLSQDSIRCKHVLNLVLGAYYMAYSVMDNELLECFLPSAKDFAGQAKEGARTVYESTLGYYSLCVQRREWWGIMAGINNSHLGYQLPGFEVLDEEGRWRLPNWLEDSNRNSTSPSPVYASPRLVSAHIYTKENRNPSYRFTYEILTDGYLSKLDVPDGWYFIPRKF